MMTLKRAWQRLSVSPLYRLTMFIIGCGFIILAPLVAPLPGPGGIVVFALGLGLVLRNSLWAKRRYVRLKRKRPKLGDWADWGLRRGSALRRFKRERDAR